MEKEFNTYRRWFNQMFSLSFDGKFKGLSTLVRLYGYRFVEHMKYKIEKAMRKQVNGYLWNSDIITLRLNGHVVKLYNR